VSYGFRKAALFGVVLTTALSCLHARALVIDERREIPMFKPDENAMRATIAVRLRIALERLKALSKDWSRSGCDAAKKEAAAIEKDLARVAEGKSLLVSKTELLMGYRSDLDDSEQPYSLWIPEEYEGTTPFPLVVLLHGQGMFNPLQCRATPIGKMIVVAPQGRGGMDYMYVGEGDVLRVIEEAQRLLNVDPERVYLAGASMGGAGSWHLASMFPDRFAGIMACCGNTDINVWAELWHWRTPQDSPIAAVRHFLREDTCAVTYAENLHNIGIVALQGQADPIVNQLHARRMQEALAASGHAKCQFHVFPFVMHGFTADYEAGLKPLTRDSRPLRVRYKTAWLKYPGAYWLKIAGLQQRLKHAAVDGLADPQQQAVEVKTQNVTELAIDRRRLPFDGKLARLTIDGCAIDPRELTHETLRFLRAADGTWKPLPGNFTAQIAPSFPPRKNAQIEGPLEHAFMSRFLIVAGNSAKDDDASPMERAIRRAADDFVEQWKTRFAVPCRRKLVTEVTPQDIADSNLILIGTPETNALTARVLPKLPLAFAKEGIRLGEKTYVGANAGAMLCYPNPLNPERYVGLIAGTTPESYRDIHVRFGNWFDWVPYDYRKHFDFAVFDDLTCGRHPESFLVWGFFNETWQLQKELTFEAVPAWREQLLARVTSVFDPADKHSKRKRPPVLNLDEVVPQQASVTKEYLERNRTLDGKPLQLLGKSFGRGLCCRFPCSLTFNCEGYDRLSVTAGVEWDGATEPCDDRKKFEKVKITIQADDKLLYEISERTYRSEPCLIEVELNGAQTVTLSASGGLPWLNGSFIWADGKLQRGRPKE
jgi:dienelactone hydrolase